MKSGRLIVESAAKAALKEASGLRVVSGEALDYVNAQAAAAVADCAARGRRTPGGRLMAPDGGIAFPTVTTELRADGSPRPERLCARAKEFAALSPEHQAEIVHRLYVQSPAINDAAIALLKEISEEHAFDTICRVVPADHFLPKLIARARSIVKSAEDLLK
jgi:hypothetical protein